MSRFRDDGGIFKPSNHNSASSSFVCSRKESFEESMKYEERGGYEEGEKFLYYRLPHTDHYEGPFSEEQVQHWYQQRYFFNELEFAIGHDVKDPPISLERLIDLNGRECPFRRKPAPNASALDADALRESFTKDLLALKEEMSRELAANTTILSNRVKQLLETNKTNDALRKESDEKQAKMLQRLDEVEEWMAHEVERKEELMQMYQQAASEHTEVEMDAETVDAEAEAEPVDAELQDTQENSYPSFSADTSHCHHEVAEVRQEFALLRESVHVLGDRTTRVEHKVDRAMRHSQFVKQKVLDIGEGIVGSEGVYDRLAALEELASGVRTMGDARGRGAGGVRRELENGRFAAGGEREQEWNHHHHQEQQQQGEEEEFVLPREQEEQEDACSTARSTTDEAWYSPRQGFMTPPEQQLAESAAATAAASPLQPQQQPAGDAEEEAAAEQKMAQQMEEMAADILETQDESWEGLESKSNGGNQEKKEDEEEEEDDDGEEEEEEESSDTDEEDEEPIGDVPAAVIRESAEEEERGEKGRERSKSTEDKETELEKQLEHVGHGLKFMLSNKEEVSENDQPLTDEMVDRFVTAVKNARLLQIAILLRPHFAKPLICQACSTEDKPVELKNGIEFFEHLNRAHFKKCPNIDLISVLSITMVLEGFKATVPQPIALAKRQYLDREKKKPWLKRESTPTPPAGKTNKKKKK